MKQKRNLECPKCMGELFAGRIGDDQGVSVTIDRCFACKGIWFDQGKLAKTLSLRLHFEDKKFKKDFTGEWRDVVLDLKKARCPHCRKEMKRVVRKSRGPAIAVDHCLSCHGIWLDGGEIRYLMRGSWLKKAPLFIFHRLKDLFQKQPLAKSLKRGTTGPEIRGIRSPSSTDRRRGTKDRRSGTDDRRS